MAVLSLRHQFYGLVRVVVVSGEVDPAWAPVLRVLLAESAPHDRSRLVLDLSQVDLLDSGGLTVLIDAVRHPRSGTRHLSLVGRLAPLRHLLPPLEANLPVFADRARAVEAARHRERPDQHECGRFQARQRAIVERSALARISAQRAAEHAGDAARRAHQHLLDVARAHDHAAAVHRAMAETGLGNTDDHRAQASRHRAAAQDSRAAAQDDRSAAQDDRSARLSDRLLEPPPR